MRGYSWAGLGPVDKSEGLNGYELAQEVGRLAGPGPGQAEVRVELGSGHSRVSGSQRAANELMFWMLLALWARGEPKRAPRRHQEVPQDSVMTDVA